MIQKYHDAINWLAKNTLVINEAQRVEKYKHIAALDELVHEYKKLEKMGQKSQKVIKCQKVPKV